MSSVSNLETLFRHVLEKKCYPTGDIRWSLGYCQGDGASFSGKLDVAALGKRLCPEVHEDVWAGLPDDFELTLTRYDNRYVHENSTSLNYDARSLEGSDVESWGGVAQKAALGLLLPKLKEDIYVTGASLAALGYKYYEMTPFEDEVFRTYQTQNFEVKITLKRDECLDYDLLLDEDLDDPLQGVIDDINAEKYKIVTLCVKVSQIDEDGDEIAELAEEYLGGVSYQKGNPRDLQSVVREIASEAISRARVMFNKQRRVTLKAA